MAKNSRMGSLVINTRFSTADVRQGVKDAEKSFKQLGNTIERQSAKGTKSINLLKGVLQGFASHIARLTKNALPALMAEMENISRQNTLARSMGGTVNALRAMQQAARETGIEDLSRSLELLQRRLGQADLRVSTAGDALRAFNLSASDLVAQDLDGRIAMLANAVNNFGGSTQQATKHLADLGFLGDDILGLLRTGSANIMQYREEIDKLGGSVSQLEAQQVQNAVAAVERLKTAWTSMITRATVALAPYLNAIADWANGFLRGGESATDRMNQLIMEVGMTIGKMLDGIQTNKLAQKIFGLEAPKETPLRRMKADLDELIPAFDRLRNATEMIDVIGVQAGMGEWLTSSFPDVQKHLSRNMFGQLPSVFDPKEVLPKMESEMEAMAHEIGILQARYITEKDNVTAEQLKSTGWMSDYMMGILMESRERAQEQIDAIPHVNLVDSIIGVDDVNTEEAKSKMRPAMDAKLETLMQYHMDEEALIRAHLIEMDSLIRGQLATGAISRVEASQLYINNAQQAADEMEKIAQRQADAEAAIWQEKLGMMRQFFGDMSSLMNTESRALFEVGKWAAMAEATVSGYAAAVEAWKQGMKIHWGAAVAMSGASLVATSAQIYKISQTKFDSPSVGSTSMSSQSAVSTAKPQYDVYVRGLNPNDIFTGQQVMDIINEQIKNGGRIRGYSYGG